MKKVFIFLLLICLTQCLEHQVLNFQDAITKLNQKLKYSELINHESKNLRLFYKSVSKLNNFNISLPNVTAECYPPLLQFFSALSQGENWSIRVIDSFGKPPSGILQGALNWHGEYSECINITEKAFVGKYCFLSKPLPQDQLDQYSFLMLKYGICMPKECNEQDIASIVNIVISNLPKNITKLIPFNLTMINSSYVNCVEPKSLDTPAYIAIMILAFLLALVGLGTIYDLFKRLSQYYQLVYILDNPIVDQSTGNIINNDEKQKLIQNYQNEKESAILKILLGFSIYTNSIKLFKISKNDDQLQCLHAIRFLSIGWVVLGHNYAFQIAYSDDILLISETLKRFSFMIVSNAFFSVDSFFLLSGLLTSYMFLKECSKSKLSIGLMVKYYFHRFWRLTPPYMLVLMFSACLSKYLGNGPNYPKGGFETNGCKTTWWKNLLYINNFLKDGEPACLGVSWYLANDMQFHVIAPIVLIPLAFGKQLIGIAISVLILIGNIIATALIINHYPGTELGTFSNNPEYMNKIYITPWCRIGPYIVGVLLGYAIFVYKKNPGLFRIKKEIIIMLWLGNLSIMGLMLFGIYPNFKGEILSRIENLLYQSSSRTIWGLGLAFIIFACLSSNGGFINKILCWSIWQPLSRLSFALYLIHSTVLLYYNSSQEYPIHMDNLNIAYNYVGNLAFSLIGAYLVSMIFEIPFLGIEKIILK